MNIMLANIMERIAEIGLRRSVGARVEDIFKQFLAEAIVICAVGGIVGVLFGSLMTGIAGLMFTIPVRISLLSLLAPFLASTLVGVIFGVLPAKRAAQVTPIEALQHD
jgi:ABC-type antimicrobial peptide transport system permease subunit